MRGRHIPFGLNVDGYLVDVSEVNRGHKCGCFCPGCGAQLSARQGQKVTWYFAHANGADCDIGYESALHLAVKKIIDEAKSLLLPPCIVSATKTQDHASPSSEVTYHYLGKDPREGIAPDEFDLRHPNLGIGKTAERLIKFDRVALEQQLGDIRPDIIANVSEKNLIIEVAVTHFVDANKTQKIQARKISTIEIDLSEYHDIKWTWSTLKKIVLGSIKNKAWLHNEYAQFLAKKDLEERVVRVKPVLEAQAREKAFIKQKVDAAIDAAMEKAAKRRKYYEENIAAAYDLKIKWTNSLTHHLELCSKHIRLTAWYITSHPQPSLCEFVARRFKGKFNHRFSQWEFPSSLDLFFEIAEFILQHDGCKLSYFKCPPGTSFEMLPIAIQKRIPSS